MTASSVLPILIAANGTIQNPGQNMFLSTSPITGASTAALFQNQITICCYDEVETLSNGLIVPVKSSVVKIGLSGTLAFAVFSADDAPYPTSLAPSDTIDISSQSTLSYVGLTEALQITATAITGCNYINILLARGIL